MTTPFNSHDRQKGGFLSGLRTSFLTGIVVIAPISLTLWLIWSLTGWIDSVVLPLVPERLQPDLWLFKQLGLIGEDQEFSFRIRGVGVVVFLVFTITVGWIAKGLLGRSLVRLAESVVERVPVVRSVYSGVKQIAETVFAQTERSFEKACLVEYPRRGIWAIGFISSSTRGEVAARAGTIGPMVSVFVPTTPNPTSGFLLFFPEDDVIELDMSIEDAAKLVISAGLVYPGSRPVDDRPHGLKDILARMVDRDTQETDDQGPSQDKG